LFFIGFSEHEQKILSDDSPKDGAFKLLSNIDCIPQFSNIPANDTNQNS